MTSAPFSPTLSKSDFKAARTCPAKLYYRELGYSSTNDDDEYMQMLADGGYMVEMLAKLLHPGGIAITMVDGVSGAAAETMQLLMQDSVVLFDATVCSGVKVARADILKKHGQTFDLFEVKARSLDQERTRRLPNQRYEPILFKARRWHPCELEGRYRGCRVSSNHPAGAVPRRYDPVASSTGGQDTDRQHRSYARSVFNRTLGRCIWSVTSA